MTPAKRAEKAIKANFGKASFDPAVYDQLLKVVATAIEQAVKDAVKVERKECAEIAWKMKLGSGIGDTINSRK